MTESKRQNLRLHCTDEQRKYITDNLDTDRRLEILIYAADCESGKAITDLTQGLGEENQTTLMVAPMFIGADSTDITAFITDVWQRPIDDDNFIKVAHLFKQWYQLTAPDEYRSPTKHPAFTNPWGEI